MLKFAVCDDDIIFCEALENYVHEYGTERSVEIETEIYYSGECLLYDLHTTYYDLLFLDITLGGVNGVEIGRRLREDLHNNSTQIIFISADNRCAMELFRIRPFNFLLKPVKKKELFQDLDLVVELADRNATAFTYSVGRIVKRCKYQDIMYFERAGRRTEIVYRGCREGFYASLKDLSKKLAGGHFFFCHESLLVNFDNIKEFFPDKLVMVNEDVLEISQSKRGEVRELKKRWLN